MRSIRPALLLTLSVLACADDRGTTPRETASGSSSTASTEGTESTGVSTEAASTDADASGSSESGDPDDPVVFDGCGQALGQWLGPNMPWNRRIDDAPVAPDSAAVIAYLQENVDDDTRFQIDFSITVLEAPPDTPRVPFEPTGDFYSPDCDPAPIPIPADGHLEGESGYACEGDGDCHLIVVDHDACRLYEQWRANLVGPDRFESGCLAIWELDRDYDEALRGDYCTSADAAGLPITALLFTAEEIDRGHIDHAIRFIVPNPNIRADTYVRPGTHSTPATAGPDEAPPYSARLRLRPDVDLSPLGPAARVVATALQRYGMILADAGNLTFTAASDAPGVDGPAKITWDAVGLGPHDLKPLAWSDFEVIDSGPTLRWSSGDCTREPIAE